MRTTGAYLQENMGETGTEVGSIDVQLLLPGSVDVLAARAVDFDAAGGQFFADTDGKHILALTEDSRAIAKGA